MVSKYVIYTPFRKKTDRTRRVESSACGLGPQTFNQVQYGFCVHMFQLKPSFAFVLRQSLRRLCRNAFTM